MKKQIKVLLAVLIVVLLCVFAYSGYQVYDTLHNYHVSNQKNNGLRGQFVLPAVTLAPFGNSASQAVEESPITVDFDELLKLNGDVIGWLYCEDTPIDNVVVRGSDNDYYLRRFLDGSYSASGTLFADWLCARDFSSRNTVIYGHNMNNGTMFASIRKYVDQEYYDEHPVLYLNTPEQDYKLEVFSGYITPSTDNVTYAIGFVDDESFMENIEIIRSRSNFQTDVTVTSEDRIVTLSTCTYEFNSARYVLVAKLVPIGTPSASAAGPSLADAPVG